MICLQNCCEYATRRLVDRKSEILYISTENMLPNKGGVCKASSIPVGSVIEYKAGDVLISNIRPYFQKIWYADKAGGCSADVLCIRAKENTDSRYLYYLLSQQAFFDYIMSGAKGCKMPRGDKKQIMQWPVNLPPLAEQKRIAGILGALDDKIELNRRINANLEEQIKALFKALFIDKQRDTDKNGVFNDIILETLSGDWGQENTKGAFTSEVYCIRGVDIPDIQSGNKGRIPIRYILEKNLAKKKLSANDIVVEISGGSPTQSTGRVCLITDSLLNRLGKDLICTNFCRAIKPIPEYAIFIYLYWQYLYDQNTMFSYENGTTGIKNLNIADFLSKEPITIPDNKTVVAFNNIVSPLYNNIILSGLESERLSSLRDTLLPKLMSGEINIEQNS